MNKYDEYIYEHKENVNRALKWLITHTPQIFENDQIRNDVQYQCEWSHDASKLSADEYEAYNDYFYGNNKSNAVVERFRYAWLLHIHRNPHHWQYWVLINDDPEEGEIILDMPDNYIIEMICDWWSFSWKKGQLNEIFSWYNEHKKHMKLSSATREKVETILDAIKAGLAEEGV